MVQEKKMSKGLKDVRYLLPEQQVQITLVRYIKYQYPEVAKYIVKIDNEAKLTKTGHIIRNKMGLHKGASDLFIAYPIGKYHGMWLEIKREGFKLTASNRLHTTNQINFINKMREVGYYSAMAAGFDECKMHIDNYLKD